MVPNKHFDEHLLFFSFLQFHHFNHSCIHFKVESTVCSYHKCCGTSIKKTLLVAVITYATAATVQRFAPLLVSLVSCHLYFKKLENGTVSRSWNPESSIPKRNISLRLATANPIHCLNCCYGNLYINILIKLVSVDTEVLENTKVTMQLKRVRGWRLGVKSCLSPKNSLISSDHVETFLTHLQSGLNQWRITTPKLWINCQRFPRSLTPGPATDIPDISTWSPLSITAIGISV